MKPTTYTMESNFTDDTAIKIHRALYDIIGERTGVKIEFDLYKKSTGECVTKPLKKAR